MNINHKFVFILYVVISFSMFVPFVSAVSDVNIIVKTPKTDQIFTVGDNIISWHPPTGIDHVKIDLYKGNTLIKCIDMYIDNSGEFIWVISSEDKYEYGCDYQIKISGIVSNALDGWSGQFCINLHPKIISINVVAAILFVLLIIVAIVYYNKKTHKIQYWIYKIKKKLKYK